jgi:hypothetical protein
VLREYELADRLEWTRWDEMSGRGDLGQSIDEAVMESRFGICYMSEPAEDGAATAFIDNPNVVFEAGMLHAWTTASAKADAFNNRLQLWIPIRERDSPPAPFDFGAMRILIVPRSKSGELEESSFWQILAYRIDELLAD